MLNGDNNESEPDPLARRQGFAVVCSYHVCSMNDTDSSGFVSRPYTGEENPFPVFADVDGAVR